MLCQLFLDKRLHETSLKISSQFENRVSMFARNVFIPKFTLGYVSKPTSATHTTRGSIYLKKKTGVTVQQLDLTE